MGYNRYDMCCMDSVMSSVAWTLYLTLTLHVPIINLYICTVPDMF